MSADRVVAAVSDRRRRSEVDATVYVAQYKFVAEENSPLRQFATEVEYTYHERGTVSWGKWECQCCAVQPKVEGRRVCGLYNATAGGDAAGRENLEL